MQVDDPPYLSVGTAVSAKYKGAFCEAKVSKVVRIVKCKVTYKMGLGNATLSDEQIKGTLRVGQLVQAKHPDKKELIEATIAKIQDCSQYTVVFDDGDITTLRRTALCLKSGRHFNESETLDQLPLTHPEHFGNPVVGGRRGRRNRQLKEDSSDDEVEEETAPDLGGYLHDIGRVVSVEATDKKRNKDNWFPGLVVIPSAQPTVRINAKEEYLIRSFKDGRYYTVPKKEVSDFSKEMRGKVESSVLTEAIQKALRFLDHNELPVHWERNSLFHSQSLLSESDENFTDSSDDEPCEEKDLFVAQLYKFMDDAGTPLNKTPTIATRDIDLHRLFRVVQKMGGFNRVTNQNKWRTVTSRMRLPSNQNTFNQVKSVYKKCLASYETFHRTLGVTMLNHTRSTKKNRGRSLIRDKDRATPININSPIPEKEDEVVVVEKKDPPPVVAETSSKPKKIDKKRIAMLVEITDTNSSDATTDQSETISGSVKDLGRPRRERESKFNRDKKIKTAVGEKVKALVEKFEEQAKKDDEDKVQFTRSKSLSKQKDPPPTVEKKPETKINQKEIKPSTVKSIKKVVPPPEEEKKKGKKRAVENVTVGDPLVRRISIGDKLKVYYGPTIESKVTYEAKVIEIDKDQMGPVYLVHYTGWNTRYDEWIRPLRIAENLSATTKAKRLKLKMPIAGSSKAQIPKTLPKRGRGSSLTGRSSLSEAPRSTTPSSVTSSSSRTKSPATPATRSTVRLTRQDPLRRTRRISAQTDVSNHTESDTEETGSESELSRTRSGGKTEDLDIKTYKRKINKPPVLLKSEKHTDKEDEDTEKEDEPEKSLRRTRRVKRSPEKSAEESEDEINPPKGRDFDLNQIRSELKGFNKAIKVVAIDAIDKEIVSSSDDSTNPPPLEKAIKTEDEPDEGKSQAPLEKSSSSEDIYEFKEPEPFEFESRTKLVEDKNIKKRLVPRLFEDIDKSPKRIDHKMSPAKSVKEESPERRPFSRVLMRRQDSNDESDEEEEDDEREEEEEETVIALFPPTQEEDPFDKLVESPSFNLVKTADKTVDNVKVVRNLSEDSLSLFRELPETIDDYSRDMELSDCESQTQIFVREGELFCDTFSKPSPDHNTLDLEFSSGKTDDLKMKDSDDEDMLREQIQRVIAQSVSTDDDSNDGDTIRPMAIGYSIKKEEVEPVPIMVNILGMSTGLPIIVMPVHNEETEKENANDLANPKEVLVEVVKEEEETEKVVVMNEEENTSMVVEEKSVVSVEKQIISPALQETDSSLLESIVSAQPPIPIDLKLEETAKELGTIKTGTKIADSILQKLNSIRNEIQNESPRSESPEIIEKEDKKSEFNFDLPKDDPKPVLAEIKPLVEEKPTEEPNEVEAEILPKVAEEDSLKKSPNPKFEAIDSKKRKKVLSRAFIDETDTDSSDSEQLVIARSDEDSQTYSLDNKIHLDHKGSDSSNMFVQMQTTDDSQSQEERNFNFDLKEEPPVVKQPSPLPPKEDVFELKTDEIEEECKEDEPDSHLHSLLLCEEEIPRSPAPAVELQCTVDIEPAKSVLEMPFASAPGTSNSKSMLLEQIPIASPSLELALERESRVEVSTLLDNTPPTTPDSTISNLSPRGEIGDLSPNTGDNESCKSNDIEPIYPRPRRNSSIKMSPYSEEDTRMTGESSSMKKLKDELLIPGSCKKRRKSLRNSDDTMPSKRSRRSRNRSTHSDSDDTSEHSNTGSAKIAPYVRSTRSPRPSKYNFFVEFDPSLDSGQRIAVLQQKLSELRKTYADVRAELAAVERRRKKIRRREREALKAAKQELTCA